MDILMLDLEGVLVTSAQLFVDREMFREKHPEIYNERCQLRPYTREFMAECERMFDKIYMNTVVDEEHTFKIMRGHLGFDIEYWEHVELKTEGYEELAKNNRIVHVEDGALEEEIGQMKRLDVHYIDTLPYESVSANKDDKELLNILEKIRAILSESAK